MSETDVDGTCEYVLDPDDPETWGGEEGDDCYVDEDVLNEDGVWTCPHDAEEGGYLCIFHLPIEEKDEAEVVEQFHHTAFDIDNSRSEDKQPHIIGAKIKTLYIKGNKLQGTHKSNILLNHSTISGTLEFDDVELESKMCFDGCTCMIVDITDSEIKSEISFRDIISQRFTVTNTEFKHSIDFTNSDIDVVSFSSNNHVGGVSFGNVNINAKINFENCTFNSAIAFSNSDIKYEFGFEYNQVKSKYIFRNVELDGKVTTFFKTVFDGQTEFDQSDFNTKTIDFRDCVFNDRVTFAGSTFSGNPRFDEATFKDKVFFQLDYPNEQRFTKFEQPPSFEYADLSQAEFRKSQLKGGSFKNADLTDAVLENSDLCRTNLENTLLSRSSLFSADLRGAKFSGAVLGDVRIDEDTKFLGEPSDDTTDDDSSVWDTWAEFHSKDYCVYDPNYEGENKQEDVDNAKSVYRALEELGGKAARTQLQSESFVRRQDLQQKQYWDNASDADNPLEWLINVAKGSRAKVARATLLYGESPWRVIAWSLGIIVSFALLYPLGGWMKPADGDPITYAQIASNPVEILNSVYYSTLTYTALGFGDFQPVGFGRLLTTLETGLGAVMLALLVFILGQRAAR